MEALQANIMSCQAMLALAKKEHETYNRSLNYNTKCEFVSNKLIDQNARSLLLQNDTCFTHDPSLKSGSYFAQIEDVRKESFEQWTRSKTISTRYKLPKTQLDLDSEFFNCQPELDTTCLYFSNGANTEIKCPSKCEVHPMPCPNRVK